MIKSLVKNLSFFSVILVFSTQGYAMRTSDYLEKWEVVLKNPSHLSSDQFSEQAEVKALMQELSQAFSTYKIEASKAKSEDGKPQLCLPRQGNLQINDIIAAVKELPIEWRSREFYESFREMMRIRYPCSQDVGTVP